MIDSDAFFETAISLDRGNVGKIKAGFLRSAIQNQRPNIYHIITMQILLPIGNILGPLIYGSDLRLSVVDDHFTPAGRPDR